MIVTKMKPLADPLRVRTHTFMDFGHGGYSHQKISGCGKVGITVFAETRKSKPITTLRHGDLPGQEFSTLKDLRKAIEAHNEERSEPVDCYKCRHVVAPDYSRQEPFCSWDHRDTNPPTCDQFIEE